jgi:hypothetical protein
MSQQAIAVLVIVGILVALGWFIAVVEFKKQTKRTQWDVLYLIFYPIILPLFLGGIIVFKFLMWAFGPFWAAWGAACEGSYAVAVFMVAVGCLFGGGVLWGVFLVAVGKLTLF